MNNIVSGDISGRLGHEVQIDGPLGRFTVPVKSNSTAAGKVSFVIAADRVSLSTPAAQDSVTNGVNGSVIGIEFVGSPQTIFFDVNGHEFRVQKQQHEIDALDLTPGKRLALSWQPQHAWLLPEAA